MCVCIFLGVFVLQIHGHLLHRDIFIYHDVHMRAYGPHEYLWHGVSTQMLIVVVGEALTLSSCWAVNKHTDTCHSFKGIVGRMYTHTCRININIHIYSSRYIDLCIIYIIIYIYRSWMTVRLSSKILPSTRNNCGNLSSQRALWCTVDDAQICRSLHGQNVGSIGDPSAESTRITHIYLDV